MKLIQGDGRNKLVVTKSDWLKLGRSTGWMSSGAVNGYYNPGTQQEINEVTVEKYGKDFWAVFVDGLLLSVCVYKRGAISIKGLLEELTAKIRQLSQLERHPNQVERPEIAQQENEKEAV